MKSLASAFEDTLKSNSFVLKKLTIYFGIYFFIFSFFILILFKIFGLDLSASPMISAMMQGFFISISKAFTAFMVPFYAYKYSKKTPPFWDFISENVWPVVLNSIKALFVVLFFLCFLPAMFFLISSKIPALRPSSTPFLIKLLCFLALPGIYKMIRFAFLVETVLFCKNKSERLLKKAIENTKGFLFFCLITLFLFFSFLLQIILPKISLIFPGPLKVLIGILIGFYLTCFFTLLKTQFFFKIMESKGNEISL